MGKLRFYAKRGKELFEEVAKGEANKIFIPFEATQALSSLGAMSDIVKDKKDNK